MIRRIPVRDVTSNDGVYALEGEQKDTLPKDSTVYIDKDGNTYDPQQRDMKLEELPESGVIQLPRTTWWAA